MWKATFCLTGRSVGQSVKANGRAKVTIILSIGDNQLPFVNRVLIEDHLRELDDEIHKGVRTIDRDIVWKDGSCYPLRQWGRVQQ